MLEQVVGISHLFASQLLTEGCVAVDATCGNGYDTVFLSKRVGRTGKVYAFDLQEEAIVQTRENLKRQNCADNVILIHDSHENMLKYIKEAVNFAVFNLGYLPNGDKRIITKSFSTLRALSALLQIMKEDGLICICSYVGHNGGIEEYEAIKEYCAALNPDAYPCAEIKHFTRREDAPRIILIEKKLVL
jgi:precorrin-6B methylase 2